MVNVILTHEVKDFASWKLAFDEGELIRTKAGVSVWGMYTAVENPNKVTIITEFPSAEAVQGFISSPGLRADMEKGGVLGEPHIQVLNKV